MWGKRSQSCGGGFRPRTIPTHVGKTFTRDPSQKLRADHPHACGENTIIITLSCSAYGPSPRMWGKPRVPAHQCHTVRTIPTHVGKTSLIASSNSLLTDHPHACGENISMFYCSSFHCGPSPRMWGKPHRNLARSDISRTIPTHVGKTAHLHPHCPLGTDHPHACGENRYCTVIVQPLPGPSPRMWGKPIPSYTSGTHKRTIPTHVGKTLLIIQPLT